MMKGQHGGIDRDQLASLARAHGWLLTQALEVSADPVLLILAHGAGAPMDSAFMEDMATRLAAQGVGVLRFEFPYMAQRREGGGKRPPNPQEQLLECWRRVHAAARECCKGRLAIGGKSMGGRMASLLADELGVQSLVCLGYPFYAAGKPEKPRVAHLENLRTRTLIVQGERDALGNRETVTGYALSPAIEILWIATGNHDLKPLKTSGLEEGEMRQRTAAAVAEFLRRG